MTSNRPGRLLDYAALRARISIAEVLALLHYQPRRQRAAKCRGRCPLHQSDQPLDSKSTCFSVDLQRNLFHCFACGAKGNQLDLWRLHTKLPLYQAALHLCQQTNIIPPTTPKSATPKPTTPEPPPSKNNTPTHQQTGPTPHRH